MEDIRKGVCPLCRHNEIIESALSNGTQQLSVALLLPTPMGGGLRLHTCRRCGFSQLFAASPDLIPVEAKYGTRLIKGPEPAGPYR